jgi:hypothetical protein
MPIQQPNSVSQSVHLLTIQMIAHEHVSKDVLPQMDLWVLLETMRQEYANKIVNKRTLLLILKP